MKLNLSKNQLSKQLKGKTYSQIAKEYNVGITTVYRRAKKFNLPKSKKQWSSQELLKLEENYLFNQDMHLLFPNRTFSSVYHKANRLGLKREMCKRKYAVNKHFFAKWTPEMAYVFGFFCADGNVSINADYCGLHIHKNDKVLLEKINTVMQSNYPIVTCDNAVQLRIYNKILCKDLIDLGCFPQKSLQLTFPIVSKKFLSHFIRGFFDGDGSIHFNKPNVIKVSFISTPSFIETLRQLLSETVNVNKGNLRKHYKVRILTYFGDHARAICNWMYHSSNDLFLDRKKNRFDNHLKRRYEMHGT